MRYIDSSIRSAEETLGFWMQETVESGIRELRCQSGYFTLEGLSVLLPALKKCASEGAVVRLLIGSNQGVTLASHVAFIAGTLGIPQKNVSIGIVSLDASLFHPKAYHVVRNDGSQTAYVGSANLTGPAVEGLNIEAGVILDTKESDPSAVLDKISQRVDSWFNEQLPGLSVVNAPADVDNLLASGYLGLTPSKFEPESSGEAAAAKPRIARPRLKSIFKVPEIEQPAAAAPPAAAKPKVPRVRTGAEERRFLRHTEASFHYPQGTHPGHLLAILYYFSGDRQGTAFDDQYIRLNGSLGEGRIAAYRRQVKYKLLAAIELGLLSDIRLVDDAATYEPQLTEIGRELWSLLEPYIDENDLVIDVDEDGDPSSRMPKNVSFYNVLIRDAQTKSDKLRNVLFSIVLNMPAVKQLLKLLYHQERREVIGKGKIYETFFESESVRSFCDAMGIDPATQEGARHRCPFLINLLDACGIVNQSTTLVTVEKLALSPDMLIREGGDLSDGQRRFDTIVSQWSKGTIDLSVGDATELRGLFGDSFLTEQYYLKELAEIPNGQ